MWGDDRGSGGVLGVALLVVVAAVGLALLPVGQVLAARQTLVGAADSAALAAADTASGRVPGVPCETAAAVAARLGARLESCSVDGAIASIRLSTTEAGWALVAEARAGPPPQAKTAST